MFYENKTQLYFEVENSRKYISFTRFFSFKRKIQTTKQIFVVCKLHMTSLSFSFQYEHLFSCIFHVLTYTKLYT